LKSIKIRSPVVSLKKARNCGKNKKKEVFSRTMQALQLAIHSAVYRVPKVSDLRPINYELKYGDRLSGVVP
jgi:hypothetical protein